MPPRSARPVRRPLTLVLAVGLLAGLLPATAGAQERATTLCQDAPPASFADRGQVAAVHRAAVDCLAHLGVVEGRVEGAAARYLPGAEVRRDQMASFVVRALEVVAGEHVPGPGDVAFTDIDGTAHADRIRQLVRIGVVEGTGATTYAPGAPVTRAQTATLLLRATAWAGGTTVDALAGGPTRFVDIAGTAHEARIQGAYHLGVTAGVETFRFAPERNVTRQQMASFLLAALRAMLEDPSTCTSARDGYTVSLPAGWRTNAGDIVPRCTVFHTERFVLEPHSEIPGGLAVHLGTAPMDHEEAADEATRAERGRRTDTAGGRTAIVVEAVDDGEGLYPAGTLVYTWYIDAPDTAAAPTLIARTTSLARDYEANKRALDGMMASLVFVGGPSA
ncbi:S-layer homology domain-containing protein [Egicoccus sp. AB-alg6-2]|uniref:S-layer homology domain-containing protein n=1 Tax=Egicoccus sp. AB-alg6-2 TaxID=3242692 RepID=UPI00359D5D2C